MKTLYFLIILISGTTVLLTFSISNSFYASENQVSKEECMGGPYCPGSPPMPSASVGNKTLEVSLKLYSNSTMPNNVHYLWLRFFDENANQTIPHVTFFLNITKNNDSLLHDLFHTHTGMLTLQVNSSDIPFNGTVLGDREAILGGWLPHDNNKPVVVHAPVFNDANSTYHVQITMDTIDNDNNVFFDQSTAPRFDFYLNMHDKDMILSIPRFDVGSKQVFPQYPPFDVTYSSNPIIITQVELATALQPGNQSGTDCVVYHNGTKICQSYSSPYRTDVHSPYYDIQCAFFGGICQLTHQIERLGDQCDSLQQYPQGTQWIQIYNQMNSTVHLTHFGVTRILDDILHIQNMPPQYAGADYAGSTNFAMSPHQICSYGFIAGPIGSALEFPLNDTSLAVAYDYNGTHHVAATPFLVDLYNDSKTWQYDGSKWVFTDSSVSIPEFPFAIPILLAGIISVIIFYRVKFEK
ncbi:MAG: hypothetical protein KGH87_00900 [Thaumarchaeota archaeon]|nr:hypothetical protein [Nitrososphaerota archaeon]